MATHNTTKVIPLSNQKSNYTDPNRNTNNQLNRIGATATAAKID